MTIFFIRKIIMQDIEKNNLDENSKKFDKDHLFYILATFGLFLYIITNLYISYIADYKLFVWHPILMTIMIFFSTQGK
jgi:hypothetical protein